jgi:hypothetical protein
MIRYGKFDIPVRLLERWLLKNPQLKLETLRKARAALKEPSKFSVPHTQVASMTCAEIANVMIKQWQEHHSMRASWILEMCKNAQTGEDFQLCIDAWRVFQGRVDFANNEDYGAALAQAATRAGELRRFFALIAGANTHRVALSQRALTELVRIAPAALFADLWRVTARRALPDVISPRIYRAAFHRAASDAAVAALAVALEAQFRAAGYLHVHGSAHSLMLSELLLGEAARARGVTVSVARRQLRQGGTIVCKHRFGAQRRD